MTSQELTLFFAWNLLEACRKSKLAGIRRARWAKKNSISPEKKAERLRQWRLKNPEIAKNSNQSYAARFPKRVREAKVAARKAGLPERKKRDRARYHADPSFRLEKCLRARLFAALKGKTKATRAITLVGCDLDALWKHLEAQFQPGMTVENYGRGMWSVDHIIPCAEFHLQHSEEQEICFHFSNLQPLWESDNVKKGAKYGVS